MFIYSFELRKVIIAQGPVGVLFPPSSCRFAPCMLASLSVCVCVCVCSRLVSWQEHAETLFFFWGGVIWVQKAWTFGCNFPQRPVFLAHCSWEIFPDFWPVSASLSLSLSLCLSFSGYKQEQRQWKGTWEVGKREGFGERKLGRDFGVMFLTS